MDWIIDHQEATGDWAGIWPPMAFGLLAYALEGYSLESAPMRLGLEAIERFAWQDDAGKRIQACVSPVWDTILMCVALSATGFELHPRCSDPSILRRRGLAWLRQRQLFSSQGDWRVYRSRLTPGAFSFENHNAWYPDVDDTAAAVIAFLRDDKWAVGSSHVLDAVQWILGMQCSNGGWAAFDVDNDKLFLNKIPFSDMDSLCDPATADIVGRVLEAFGLVLTAAFETRQHVDGPLSRVLDELRKSCRRGIEFLQRSQEINGAWYGR
ncbi:Squalene hopane cyclase afumA [Fulvia fulva]|uniref:Squalene hopane cyclase afumA n=1 Tax=Passalora fulva TaxID=5499 RepID=A0A9Q8UWN0_PASFU|nr:Squalene hopane cyclase afumA [Fulvia fulva]KAK4609157.1 Squalene hopane cyclase afumA [Fulvia fulva]KAK4609935.1 Squalene hopane cyclase afumA [Fulvia fulva]UJO25077.1 Squalene hopane cyclase afumA [Fulvia fulva]WPV22532.1 Squalene hopane cyclase afumA [Fulvia fulva]WPV37646.1 Squalene hopane cyclase afumA [Fulvia fulva]